MELRLCCAVLVFIPVGTVTQCLNEALEKNCRGIHALGMDLQFGCLPHARGPGFAAVAQFRRWAKTENNG